MGDARGLVSPWPFLATRLVVAPVGLGSGSAPGGRWLGCGFSLCGWRWGWCVPGSSDAWSSAGGAGWAVAWCGCCFGRGWLLGSLAGRLRRRLACSGVGPSVGGLCRPSTTLLVVLALLLSKGWPSPSYGPSLVSRSVLQDRAYLAPGSRTKLVSRPVAGRSSSRARLQDQARLAPGAAGRIDGGQFWPAYWVSALGAAQGCERQCLSAHLFGWGSDGSRVRWCQGLGCRGGDPGGGSVVLMDRARGSVLLADHGRVGGLVAGGWRSVAVSVVRGENLFYLRTDRRRRSLSPS
ncbi:hypothetical protein VPH35_007252 [Triticum aestivum]